MSELRRDPIVGRWIIVDKDHPTLPEEFEKEEHHWQRGECPFCYGNEAMTPPEIEAIRQPPTPPNTAGWQVRVVPNKFPALQIEGDLNREGIGIYDMSNGIGAHEVVIETPYHHKDIAELFDNEVENIINIWCKRALDLIKDRRFRYIMIFKNYGPSAGASLEHPHSQIIALPMVPKNVFEELQGAKRYFEYRERCIFCDILRQEINEKERVILENKHFIAFCPYVSRFPFEVWILPKKHNCYFCHIFKEEIPSLASLLRQLLNKFKNLFGKPAYNFIIHTSPLDGEQLDSYHWHIEFMPRLTRVAGFEWGTGFYIVPTPPELAAQYLKKV
ncbi:MAG: galactose-1-phosphate uridylyltransferase [Candidatus Omnitrophica bacterium]|nr:galactose-1-phosphate uridylyltransferase [Candidatus Omnitrophota bacterium]